MFFINTRIIKETPRLNEKELVISVIELASKALHKNKASTRIRLLCGGDQLMKQRFKLARLKKSITE
ncbi:hypothetical protein [Helicobacter pylori]|uniref:hypothetical protein n=1 Tax=Helicobacter pylori TaxID=210 RepID=UPI001F0C8C70|nr:hypothetical protein [Helicobacter pylori]